MQRRIPTLLVKVSSTLALCSALALSLAGTVNAAPLGQAQPAAKPLYAPCYAQQVSLHGTDAPTVKCLAKDKPAANAVSPDTFGTSCGTNLVTPWVALYQNANYSGACIAFEGSGSVNLTNYGINSSTTWNDQMTSFNTGGNGAFWWDINDSGYYYLFGSGPGRTIQTGNIGSTWNDKASSVQID